MQFRQMRVESAQNLMKDCVRCKYDEFFPDAPPSIHRSYLTGRIQFINLPHQWLRSPDNDNSAYLDSRSSLRPGSGYTYEPHHGSGNRNRIAGAIISTRLSHRSILTAACGEHSEPRNGD